MPEGWQLVEEQAALAERNEVDLLIEEQLDQDQGFEAEDKTFAEELREMAKFATSFMTLPKVCDHPAILRAL